MKALVLNSILSGFRSRKDYAPEAKMEILSEVGVKSPSERLRNILFCIHKQQSATQEQSTVPEPFAVYYERQMDKLCEHFKGKLTPQ